MICQGILKSLNLNWSTKKLEVSLQLEAPAAELEKLKDIPLSVQIKKYRQKRSLDSNAYYWSLVTQLADKIGQSNSWVHNDMLRKYGQIETIDGQMVYIVIPDTDKAHKTAYEAQEYHIKPTSEIKQGKDGIMYRTYIMLRGSSSYDTKEMSRLIEGIASECKDLGIETMTPDQINDMIRLYEQHIT